MTTEASQDSANTNPNRVQKPDEMDVGSAWNNIKQIVRAYRGANFEEHEWLKASMESVFNALVRGAAAEETLKGGSSVAPAAPEESAQQPS